MGKATEKLQKLLPRTWTPNQVVAHNVTRARLLRGWTQEQAADELAPYLGARLSHASFSAIERSIASTRVKQFSADDLVALSRAFRVPLGWWFIPPEEGAMHTPDHDHNGVDFSELVDVVLGTPESLPAWAEALNRWEADQPADHAGAPSVTARTSELAELRARSLVRETFGDLGNARDVLRGLADLLDQLDHETGNAAALGEDVANIAQPGQVCITPPGL
jgi:transcriptional regulator with XRE-family HTH domain